MTLFQKKKNKTSSKPVKNKFFLTGVFDILLLLINFVVVGCLFLADSACWINPVKFLLPSYFGLAFPFIILVLIAFLIFWIVRLKWYFVISLTALLVSHQSVWNTFPLNFEKNKEITEKTIKILSYNVHLFNFYAPLSQNETLNYIAESDADILCLQEFGYNSDSRKKYLKENEIIQKLGKKYPYHHIELSKIRKNSSYGVAIFSKFPITQKKRVKYETKYNLTIYSDININGKTVRVFNCHLESNHLTENDKVLLKKLGEEFSNEKVNEVVENLSQKLGNSFKLRSKQATAIAQEIAKTEYPIILCGDFNDVPVSYAYTKIKSDRLIDSFTECGKGYGHTFNEKLFWFRIDQIMHSKEFKASYFKIDDVEYSDHFPIECHLSMNIDK